MGNANAVRDALGRIPRQTSPSIGTVGHGQAVANAHAVRDALGGIPRHVGISIHASSNAASAAASARGVLAALDGYTVHTYIRTHHTSDGGSVLPATGGYIRDLADAIGLAAGGMPVRRRWPAGGIVEGPGTPTSDSVPAMLSRREFVIRASAVEHYGPELLYALNARRVPRDLLPGFAGGGTLRTEPPRYLPSPTLAVQRGGGSNQTVNVTVQMPATAAQSGGAAANWLDDLAARARRMSWDVRR